MDTHARASSLRQWILRKKSIRPVRVPILNGVSFSAKPGDRVAILGANGSGKSSLLKVISGNYPIHAGSRVVHGAVVPLIEMGAGFEGEVTGRGNVRLTYAYRGKLHEYSREVEQRIIDFSELGDKIDTPFKNYSSGMMARLAFSSAIFQNPDILLLDEIFAAGDAGFVEKSRRMLLEKVDGASITLMVSHGHHEIMDMCNRFILMHGGLIINEGSARDIMNQYRKDILNLPELEYA